MTEPAFGTVLENTGPGRAGVRAMVVVWDRLVPIVLILNDGVSNGAWGWLGKDGPQAEQGTIAMFPTERWNALEDD